MTIQKRVPKILVTDVDRGSGLAIVRSLGKQGWQVFATSQEQDAVGFRSKYTSHQWTYPSPEEQPDVFIKAIKTYVEEHEIDLIIPVTDEIILPLSQSREAFRDLCQIAMADQPALDVATNKLRTLELAKSLGVPIPESQVIHTVKEAEAMIDSLKWPVVLKPMRSRIYTVGVGIEATHVTYANNATDFIETVRSLEGRCGVLVQVYHPGDGVGVEMLLYQGQVLSAFQHQRLHEVPPTGGVSSLRKSVELDPKLYEYAACMLGELKWTGLAMVEFKVNAESMYLMEINGRVWGSIPLAIVSGMNFPVQLVNMYLDDPVNIPDTPNTNYRREIKARNLYLDVVWVASVLLGVKSYTYLPTPSRARLIPAILSFFNPFYYMDIQSLDDPIPGLMEIPQIVKKLVQKASKLG